MKEKEIRASQFTALHWTLLGHLNLDWTLMQLGFSFNHLYFFLEICLLQTCHLFLSASLNLCRLAILYVSVCLFNLSLCWIPSTSEDSYPLSQGKEKQRVRRGRGEKEDWSMLQMLLGFEMNTDSCRVLKPINTNTDKCALKPPIKSEPKCSQFSVNETWPESELGGVQIKSFLISWLRPRSVAVGLGSVRQYL